MIVHEGAPRRRVARYATRRAFSCRAECEAARCRTPLVDERHSKAKATRSCAACAPTSARP
ncbi:hypothetical protein WS72_27850 [Burkholderia savannae]|uniref:Uncharacterized protein n=1 Tax=Burkholderia savannae TaxID=1637837 RepID=A0ABR5T5Y7_9BURK|nr:hypothetical protein WS72_27850 [Burkholderia savannae]